MSKRDLRRGRGPKHVQIREWFQATSAWATLKPGPRALYVELKRRYNGGNNGRIRMSVREAAELLNVHRNTVPAYFADLEARGFIREMQRGYLGAEGHGIASTWTLTELPTANGKAPEMTFQSWMPNEKPVTKDVHARHNTCANSGKTRESGSEPSQ